ncbi:hypothetical protein ACP4OV_005982 [Aristida adscensionis]
MVDSMDRRVIVVALTLERSEANPGPRTTNCKMPELRNASRTALADLSGGGFFIRRVASPGPVMVKGAVKPLARRALASSNNKENVPPVWAAKAVPKRRSPLPDWYPRTPLRDITSIVKAVERRSRLSNAAAQQQIQLTRDPSQSVDPTTPQSVLPPQEARAAVASPAASTPSSDCSTPFELNDPALADLMEKKLSSSIEQIEKIVRRNLKRTPKATQPSKRTIQRRTLMSMR